jgi:DNA-binding NarL/FixJ family response regulator
LIRVIIVDDDPRVRAGLRVFLRAHQEIELVGEADSSTSALAVADATTPSVAVVDVHLPKMIDGLELLNDLTHRLRIPAIAISLDHGVRRHALDAGAYRFLDKASVPEFLVEALQQSVQRS